MTIHRTITIADYKFIDGLMVCVGTKSKSKTFQEKNTAPMTIDSYWMKDAPIGYGEVEEELKRVGILDKNDLTWSLLYKGGAPDRYLRAFYNLFRSAKCLPVMTGIELMRAYNTSFSLDLKHERGFTGQDNCQKQEEEIMNMLSAFWNIFPERNDYHTGEDHADICNTN